MKVKMLPLGAATTIGAALAIGSAATLVPKILLSLPCDSQCAGASTLNAPIFSGFVVFVASSMGLVIEAVKVKQGADVTAAMPISQALRRYSLLLIPGVFNVLGTLLQLASLLFIPAAVLAGLRGAFILFTAVLSSALDLSDQPRTKTEWACIAGAALGAALVGAASALQTAYAPWADGSSSGTEGGSSSLPSGITAVLIGLGLSLAGYAVASGQVAYESIALDAGRLKRMGLGPVFTRWEVLGVEGLFGVCIVGVILGVLQAVQSTASATATLIDDPAHTFCCLQHSPGMIALSVAYGASSLIFNALLLVLGSSVGPNFRVFVFTARGVLTWAVEIALYYSATAAAYGQGLSLYSLLQAAGYILLICGGVYRATLQAAAAEARVQSASTPGKDISGSKEAYDEAYDVDSHSKRLLEDDEEKQ